MPEKNVLILVSAVIGGGLVAVIAYAVARFMRGSVTLSLTRDAFNPGETITGSFALHTKKNLQGNKLIVSLIGVQETRTEQNGKTRLQSREVYRDEVLVEKARAYGAGFTATYPFALDVPRLQSPEFLDSAVGQALGAAFRLLSNRSTRLKWKVEARLDAKGVDLATSRAVSINGRQLI